MATHTVPAWIEEYGSATFRIRLDYPEVTFDSDDLLYIQLLPDRDVGSSNQNSITTSWVVQIYLKWNPNRKIFNEHYNYSESQGGPYLFANGLYDVPWGYEGPDGPEEQSITTSGLDNNFSFGKGYSVNNGSAYNALNVWRSFVPSQSYTSDEFDAFLANPTGFPDWLQAIIDDPILDKTVIDNSNYNQVTAYKVRTTGALDTVLHDGKVNFKWDNHIEDGILSTQWTSFPAKLDQVNSGLPYYNVEWQEFVNALASVDNDINITINNAAGGSLTPFTELDPFYQDRVRTTVERVLMETDGVTIRQWALESDLFHTSLETMDLNELVDILSHVALVGR